MLNSATLNLSIGDDVPEDRLARSAHAETVLVLGRPVLVRLSADAIRATVNSPLPILAEMELYFSCLVRKQVRFREFQGAAPGDDHLTRVIPGFYTGFRAVTTQHCAISDAGTTPPVETLPVKQPQRFIPDWLKIDYRAGQWLGEYGFSRNFQGPSHTDQTDRRYL